MNSSYNSITMRVLVKDFRNKLKLSQEKFAFKSDISLRYLQSIESSFSLPSLTVLSKIAKAFNISIKDLIED